MPSEAYVNLVAMLAATRVTPEIPVEVTRGGWDTLENVLPLAPGVEIDDTTIAGCAARWLTPAGAGATTAVHLHGGGYVIGSPKSHTPFGTYLATALGGRVLLPDYRLAPEHPAPAAVDDAVAIYRWLLEAGVESGDVVITGDSAGGGLALALMARLRDEMVPMPSAAALISPWTDLTGTSETIRTKVDDDVVLSPELLAYWGGMYAGAMPLDDPVLSPALGDLTALPPTLVLTGTRELLLDDSNLLVDRAGAAGVDVTLEIVDDMVHIWPVLGAGAVPEAQAAVDRMAAFVRG
jgi:acetyl esterase/lipase